MRAFLINPFDRTISAIALPEREALLEAMYKAMRCEKVEKVEAGPRLDIWIDEQGNMSAGNFVFELPNHRIAGSAIVLGHDGMGASTSPDISIDNLLTVVRWTELASTGEFDDDGAAIIRLQTPPPFVIWSNEHRGWWGKASTGYVQTLREAGRYSRQHALQICRDARGGWNGITPPPEIPVRSNDAIAAGLEGRFV